MPKFVFFLLTVLYAFSQPVVYPGLDVFFDEGICEKYKDKKIALLTNHTSVDLNHLSSIERFKDFKIVALFSPEHGLKGQSYAFESIHHGEEKGIPLYSLHGETRRPKPEMLKDVEVIFYDIQCTGVRAYTYATTLFYMMEEAAKSGIEVVVLDRPNPINGLIVDGPMLEEKWRSFIGYVNVPYCHGMTIGELAGFFNAEYKIQCNLKVIAMKGWNRSMSYRDTKLTWIPPSPNIPEPDTPMFCPSTGILGELSILNIGVGYTMPFKIVGAPWIQADRFAEKLNAQKLAGVRFQPFHFRPFWGLYKGENCEGVIIQITDSALYKPLAVQYLLLGMVKSMYPTEFMKRLGSKTNKDLFCKANGTEKVYEILVNEKYPAWKLIEMYQEQKDAFLEVRKKYLLY